MKSRKPDSPTSSESGLHDDADDGGSTEFEESGAWLFVTMTKCPYPFLVTLPFLFMLLICLGFSRPSIIEEDVSNLWIPMDGTYKQDKDYAESVGAAGSDELSTFMAMSLSRDGDNLFNEDNLNAVVERMKRIETTPVFHKGIKFTWDDICFANGLSPETTYKLPCLRLSPMDLFEEARWYFTEEQRVAWYQEIKGRVVKPMLIRYGIVADKCLSSNAADNGNPDGSCDHAYRLRTDPEYAVSQGYSENHAESAAYFLEDLMSMPLNDPCRICVDAHTEGHIQEIKNEYVIPAFTTLTQQLRRFLFALEEREDVRMDTLRYVESLIKGTAAIATQVTTDDVEDFYMYYTLRGLYADGAADYKRLYEEINDPLYRSILCGNENLVCPPEEVSLEDARETLLRHADNWFSSIVSFGAPFPFWGNADGTGPLFAGTYPVSGSGVNMSAPFDSLKTYLDLENRQNGRDWRPFFYDARTQEGFVDPLGEDYLWETMVETNPVYAWFMSGQDAMIAHCGNGFLPGTNASDAIIDSASRLLVKDYSQLLCTKYHTPFEEDGTETRQHFARMWFSMLIESPYFLNIRQGESDPYSWTSGLGCGYELGGSRFSYTGQSEDTILQNASSYLYNIDESAEIGVVDRTPLIGDAYPPIGDYSFDNPLQHVGLLQTVYVTLVGKGITERVSHENRPGGPLNITEEDAAEVLALFKQSFESQWTDGWDDDNSGNVQFVGFFDDAGVPGTLATFLNSVTMSSGLLTAVSILIIASFSVIFLASRDPVKSRIGITLVGIILVMLAFFASVGLGILIGIKVNLTIAWTLPFVILGLGVDNLYIILLSLQKQGDYSTESFCNGMKEVFVPITMTSLVNASMFLVMNINSIPAVYLTAQVAVFSIVFLYLAVIFCFPAYAYLDMKRQNGNRRDLLCWRVIERTEESEESRGQHYLDTLLYDRFYKPLLFGEPFIRIITHSIIWGVAALLLALGLFGISRATVGLGLEDFLPSDHQGHLWASARTDILGSWVINMNWPDIDYTDPDVQMRMVQQFERVISTPHIVEIDTRMLWIAEFGFWSSRLCDYNLAAEDRKCGRDQVFQQGSTCAGTWKRNTHGLRTKYESASDEQCQPYDGGICRRASELHPDDLLSLGITVADNSTWCPVFEGWSQAKTEFCLRSWYEISSGGAGNLVVDQEIECEGESCHDFMVKFPIPFSAGPPMTARDVVSHELTLEMMMQTRAVCDQDPDLHCWMSGAPFDFWSQYEGIQMNLVEIAGASVFIGFGISLFFFVLKQCHDGRNSAVKVLSAGLVGALVIGGNCFFCLVAVVGISILSGVSLTAFSIMSFVLSVGFAVEYSVHIIDRWFRSDRDSALERVEQTMSFLMLPTFLSFGSSTLGVLCLAMTSFEFNTRFFFRPLIIVMFVTYFFGCWVLPSFLTILDFGFLKLAPPDSKIPKSGSPLSKIQNVESSEAGASIVDKLEKGASDDFQTHATPQPTGVAADCIRDSDTEAASSLEFLPCYDLADCAGKSKDNSKSEDYLPDLGEENSLLSELPPPLQAMSARHSRDPISMDTTTSYTTSYSSYSSDPPATPSLPTFEMPSPAPSPIARHSLDTVERTASPSSYASTMRSSSVTPSVDSSLMTIEVDNTLKNLLHKRNDELPPKHRRGPSPDKLEARRSPREETGGRSLVDSILQASSLEVTTSNEELPPPSLANNLTPSESSGAFDGIESPSTSHDDKDKQPRPQSSLLDTVNTRQRNNVSVSPNSSGERVASALSPVNVRVSKLGAGMRKSPTVTIDTDPRQEFNVVGPASTGDAIFRDREDAGGGMIQKSLSSSPRKKRFTLANPFSFNKPSSPPEAPFGTNETLVSSNDALLNTGERYDSSYGGYDMENVLESPWLGTVIQPTDTPPAPRSNRSILTGGSGEVLAVHPVFEDEERDRDTVNF
ncbi:Protein patched homolog 1 [Seminavis robusta]|uniref:Protein patched homolog 1 n=1 Tax=Seminavis robusta TaxID=568900 RepID=A0A9N8HN81_9STRA|nr:Protein patched homolog 1 [Seminavis robusta]|eukprot:Sro965_g225610.1 Protein patched homolog 1 (1927) ;mRNA; r:20824-27216